jgi:uncharacterized protein (TIRG00374 family)
VNRKLQIGLSLGISAFALWYCLHDLDVQEFRAAIGAARLVWLVPMALLAAVAMWLRARRWGVLLGTLGPLGDTPVFEATCIGFMGNMVLPLRAGELLRPLVASRAGHVSMPAALATVAIDRLLDLVMLGALTIVTLFLVPAGDQLRAAAHGLAFVVGIGIVALFAVIRFAAWIELRAMALSERLPPILARIVQEGVRGFLAGVKGLRDPRVLVPALVYSALIWLDAILGFIATALALDISAPLLPLGVATTVIVAAAVSVPSAPGFIGVFWAGSQMALGLFGVSRETALTFGLLSWIVQMVVIVGLGMWCLSRLNLSLGDMATAARSTEPAA